MPVDHFEELEELVGLVKLFGKIRILKGREIAEVRDAPGSQCPIFECAISKPELDHDHQTGRVRGTLQGEANAMIGKSENIFRTMASGKTSLTLPEVLRNMADYLEADYSESNMHPKHRKVLRNQFKRLLRSQQDEILDELGVSGDFANASERAEVFLSTILTSEDE